MSDLKRNEELYRPGVKTALILRNQKTLQAGFLVPGYLTILIKLIVRKYGIGFMTMS